uniref:Secreted protein n=1 Tax=Panstrongylus lignarius TaxID=156445 RepID=A0A224XS23_9HEMI
MFFLLVVAISLVVVCSTTPLYSTPICAAKYAKTAAVPSITISLGGCVYLAMSNTRRLSRGQRQRLSGKLQRGKLPCKCSSSSSLRW